MRKQRKYTLLALVQTINFTTIFKEMGYKSHVLQN
nr:MAG TPA: hypothetical protein [Caudoviricetes sp.]